MDRTRPTRTASLGLLLLLLSLITSAATAQVAVSSPFDAPPPVKQAYLDIAQRHLRAELARATPDVRRRVDQELAELARRPDGARTALARAASFVVLGYPDAATLYAAWAASQRPADGRAANDLGATLRAVDSKDAVPVLLYARALLPNDADVQVNLGYSAIEARDLPRAIMLFRSALAQDRNHGDAMQGLGSAYLLAGDFMQAFEWFAKANGVTFKEKSARAAEEAAQAGADEDGPRVPPAPVEPPPAPGGDESPGGRPTGLNLECPPTPHYADAIGMQTASQAKLKGLQARSSALTDRMMAAAARAGAARARARSRQAGAVPVLHEQESWAMATNIGWLSRETVRALKPVGKALEAANKDIERQAPTITSAFEQHMKTCATPSSVDVAGCQRAEINACKQVRGLREHLWGAYMGARDEAWRRVGEASKRFYKAQAQWIRRVDDADGWAAANAQREVAVLSGFMALLSQDEVAGMALAMPLPFGGAEHCPEEKPEPEKSAGAGPGDLQMEDVPQVPCPFAKHPLEIGPHDAVLGLKLSASLGCQSVSVSGDLEGISASWERKFHKSTTVRMQFEASKGFEGPTGTALEVKAKATVEIVSEDRGATVMTTGVEASATGTASFAGQELASASIVAGLSSDFTLAPPPPPKQGGAKR